MQNTWREPGIIEGFEVGTTSIDDIMAALGPPSQMIDLENGPMLYYLLERSDTEGLTLFVYNTQKIRVRYDRAAFLCDRDGGNLEQVTFFDGPPGKKFDGFPMFSRDGRFLAFSSNRGDGQAGDTNVFIAEWIP